MVLTAELDLVSGKTQGNTCLVEASAGGEKRKLRCFFAEGAEIHVLGMAGMRGMKLDMKIEPGGPFHVGLASRPV